MSNLGRPRIPKKRRVVMTARFTADESRVVRNKADSLKTTTTNLLREGLRCLGVELAKP